MRGQTVVLTVKTQSGTDAFGVPTYTETTESVSNVLIGFVTSDENINNITLYGKKAQYCLGIPKGDTHIWEDTKVAFFGHTFRTFGPLIEGQEELIPGPWHHKIMVERYE